ncbi:MAG: ferredoxin--NADP reductase [Cyclobacteriaceae bacterium]|nr:ferredoxin--NADP reductase [Cyclobacteriaceae bacterium SS2]
MMATKASIKVKRVIRETPDAITLELEQHQIIARYQPGQFLNFFLEIDGKEVVRQYSFSSTALLNETPGVTIKKVDGGLASNYLIDHTKSGDSVMVSAPGGRFTTTFGKDRNVLMIAGGSGITPLFSILKSILSKESGSKVTLLYANKDYESIIFRNELESLQRQYGRLHVTHFLSVQDTAIDTHLDIKYRRINQSDLQKQLANTASHPEVFLCGPDSLMNFSSESLTTFGITPESIRTEAFTGYGETSTNDNRQRQSEINIQNLDGKLISFLADQNKPILQSALEAGIRLPHSCKEAMCGTCKIRLTSGKINMKANYALPDDELDDGYVLLCSGFPESDILDMMYG